MLKKIQIQLRPNLALNFKFYPALLCWCLSFEFSRCCNNCAFFISVVKVLDMAAPSLIPRPGSSWTAASLFSPQPHSSPHPPPSPSTYMRQPPTNKNSYSEPFQSSYPKNLAQVKICQGHISLFSFFLCIPISQPSCKLIITNYKRSPYKNVNILK